MNVVAQYMGGTLAKAVCRSTEMWHLTCAVSRRCEYDCVVSMRCDPEMPSCKDGTGMAARRYEFVYAAQGWLLWWPPNHTENMGNDAPLCASADDLSNSNTQG